MCCTASNGPGVQKHFALEYGAAGRVFRCFQNHPDMRKVARPRPLVKIASVTTQVHYLGFSGTGEGAGAARRTCSRLDDLVPTAIREANAERAGGRPHPAAPPLPDAQTQGRVAVRASARCNWASGCRIHSPARPTAASWRSSRPRSRRAGETRCGGALRAGDLPHRRGALADHTEPAGNGHISVGPFGCVARTQPPRWAWVFAE